MRPRLAHYLKNNGVAFLALFVALGGTSAYAVNTINSTDIVDGQVKSVDIANDSIHSGDILDNTINTFDVHSFLGVDVVDGTLTGSDVSDSSTLTGSDIAEGTLSFQNALQTGDIGTGAIRSDEIANTSIAGLDIISDTLTGVQINEASLNLPLSTVGFAGGGPVTLEGGLHKIAGKTLSQGVYAIVATVNTTVDPAGVNSTITTAGCQLRNGNGFIGGATDRRFRPAQDSVARTMTINGGADIPAGGGEVSVWCDSQEGIVEEASAQIMAIRVAGFF